MSITNRKITNEDINTKGVQASPVDLPVGEGENNQKIFDRLVKEVVMPKLNGLIDDLIKQTTTSGAEQIGCSGVSSLAEGQSGTVRDMIVRLKAAIDAVVIDNIGEDTVSVTHLTDDAVMLSLLTGYAIAAEGNPADLATTDKVKEALGKIERHIKNIIAGVTTAGKAVKYATDESVEGSIAKKLAEKQDNLTFDSTPTLSSANPVTSDGIKSGLNTKINLNGGDLKDAVTTFSEAGTRTNIATGEKSSTIFGKIKKFFSDLKALAFKDTVGESDIANGAVTTNKVSSISADKIINGDTNKVVTQTEKDNWNSKAPLVSPALTGSPTAPTPIASDNSTKVATTAFVKNLMGLKLIDTYDFTAGVSFRIGDLDQSNNTRHYVIFNKSIYISKSDDSMYRVGIVNGSLSVHDDTETVTTLGDIFEFAKESIDGHYFFKFNGIGYLGAIPIAAFGQGANTSFSLTSAYDGTAYIYQTI